MVRIHAGQPTFIGENENSETQCKQIAKNSGGFTYHGMKFPVTVKHRKAKVKIFSFKRKIKGGKKESRFYRIYYRTGGKNHFKAFSDYSEAHKAAKKKAQELSSGSSLALITPKEAADALAIRDALQAHCQATGRRYTAIDIITNALEADKILKGKANLLEAAKCYAPMISEVKRVDVSQAVEEFIESRKKKTIILPGQKRSKLSEHYHNQISGWLRGFVKDFRNYAVCDILAPSLAKHLGTKTGLSVKTQNLYRGAVRLFLNWAEKIQAGKESYISKSANELLQGIDEMQIESDDGAEIGVYTPKDFSLLMNNSNEALRVLIALVGLGGVRLHEALRLTWEDVWRRPGHIEISKTKSKTRSRRLIEMCPALAQWLETYRHITTGLVWPYSDDTFQAHFNALCKTNKIAKTKNALRHSFLSYHYALHGDENKTAAQAGNSPDIFHEHYNGLVTKPDAEKWFAVAPEKVAENIVAMPAAAK